MASSSYSPSSSALTIQIPSKSILKRPSAQPPSLFSRITRFLPSPNHVAHINESKPLKRAHFILPQLVTVYPISSVNPPSTPNLREEKKAIEDREADRRRRLVTGGASGNENGAEQSDDASDWWSLDKVESFYRECAAGSEEEPDPAISFAFKVRVFWPLVIAHLTIFSLQNAIGSNPRCVDLSGVQLTVNSASILSDVFSIEWGLRKLVLWECNLDEHVRLSKVSPLEKEKC